MTGQKHTPPLLGFEGMANLTATASGRQLNSADVLDLAFLVYGDTVKASGGGTVTSTEWNRLTDVDRRGWCEDAIERLSKDELANSARQDAANVLQAVELKASATLFGDLIDAALTEVKALDRPWQQMGHDAQRDVLERITERVKEAGKLLIRDLATRGNPSIVCELESITVKKGAKGTLSIPKGEIDNDLLDAVGSQVLLVIAGTSQIQDIQAPRAEADQGDLLVSAGVQHSDPRD